MEEVVVYITWSEGGERMVGDREMRWDGGWVRRRDCGLLLWDRLMEGRKLCCGLGIPVRC